MEFDGVIRNSKPADLADIRKIYSLYLSTAEDISHFVDRVRQSLDGDPEAMTSDLRYLIAEVNGKIEGIIGFRKPPAKLISFTKTHQPVELYALFVRNKQRGIGRALLEKMITTVKKSGYTEIVVYSSDKWKESWPFYDRLEFERIGRLTHKSGTGGQVWHKDLE